MQQPTVILSLGDDDSRAFFAFNEGGEVIETNDLTAEGQPDWTQGGICDGRGAAEQEGFSLLCTALKNAEANAKSIGFAVQRIQD